MTTTTETKSDMDKLRQFINARLETLNTDEVKATAEEHGTAPTHEATAKAFDLILHAIDIIEDESTDPLDRIVEAGFDVKVFKGLGGRVRYRATSHPDWWDRHDTYEETGSLLELAEWCEARGQ